MMNEIVLYRPNELAEHIEVRFDANTVWLNRQQLTVLFGRDVKTIGKHIGNVFSEGELEKSATVAKFATVQIEGDRSMNHMFTKTSPCRAAGCQRYLFPQHFLRTV